MTAPWTDDDVAAARLHRHGLTGAARDVAAAARGSAGLQAQDLAASRLAVRPRSTGLTADDVRRACDDGTVVRTWLMRGTLHLVPAADAGWLVRLFGPAALRAGVRRRRQLGLDDDTCERAVAALPEVLAGGPLTRADLVSALAAAGVRIEPKGQAPAHLVGFAAASGVVCRGPDEGTEPTYVLLDRWAPGGGPDGDAALAELARRYLAAYAPATAADFAAWAGIPAGAARSALTAIAAEVTEIATEGGPLLAPKGTRRPPAAAREAWRLLPAFDSYLLGYADRGALLDPAFAKRVNAGGGWLHPLVVHGGRMVGTWRLQPERKGRRAAEIRPFAAAPDAAGVAALEAEADDAARFLGTTVELHVAR
jgi:hypothetical protein